MPSEVSEQKSAADLAINRYLSKKYASYPQVSYLDIGPIFYQAGNLNTAMFYDPRLAPPRRPLHPDTDAQRLMAEAIEPSLTRLMNDGARQYLASLKEVNTAVIPVPKLEDDSYDWYDRHRQVMAVKAGISPDVVLIGDSITHFWAGQPVAHRVSGPEAWQRAFGGMSVLNLGFGWDRTQNVLWRLSHGEFDGLHPKTLIINIGTNNLTGTANARSNTPAEVVQGILAIHDAVRAKSPESRIVVMGVFPRGFDSASPLRAPILELNRLLSEALTPKANTIFLDIGTRFLETGGTLPRRLMNDGTHPTEEGYRIWADALIEAGLRR